MDGLVLLAVLLLCIGGFVAIGLFASRPHTAIELHGGKARLVRGHLPPGLLGDLKDVARGAPGASGTVGLRGQLDTLRVTTRGLPEHLDQRVRNVVLLRRNQIRRK
jgi:hypothetical protein